jgi:hypothetical protein
VQDPAELVLLLGRLELPAASRAGAGRAAVPSNDAAVSGDRVAVLVDAVGRVALLSLVRHLAQVMHWSYISGNSVVFLGSSLMKLVVV